MKKIILILLISTLSMGIFTGCASAEAPPRIYGWGESITMGPSSWDAVDFRAMRIEPMAEYDTSTHTGYAILVTMNTDRIPVQMDAATGAITRTLIDMTLTDGEQTINTVNITFTPEGYPTLVRFIFRIENGRDIPRRGTLIWDDSPNPITAEMDLSALRIIEPDIQDYEEEPAEPQEEEAESQEDIAAPDEFSGTPEERLIGIWHHVTYDGNSYNEREWQFNADGSYYFNARFISFDGGVYAFSADATEWGTYEVTGDRVFLMGVMDISFPGEEAEYIELEHIYTFGFDGDNLLLTINWEGGRLETTSFTRIPESVIDLPLPFELPGIER